MNDYEFDEESEKNQILKEQHELAMLIDRKKLDTMDEVYKYLTKHKLWSYFEAISYWDADMPRREVRANVINWLGMADEPMPKPLSWHLGL